MAIYDDWLLKAQRDLDTAKALFEKAYYDITKQRLKTRLIGQNRYWIL